MSLSSLSSSPLIGQIVIAAAVPVVAAEPVTEPTEEQRITVLAESIHRAL
jgi:hypothetical protein